VFLQVEVMVHPKGMLCFKFLVACSLALKKLKLLFFDICLIIRYRVKIYL